MLVVYSHEPNIYNECMRLYLARHTQTNYNVLGLANANPSVDVHLTQLGINQAEALSQALQDKPFDAIYISQLPRTRQTADIINRNHGKELIVDARLNDNRTGYEDKPARDWIEALDNSADRWNAVFNDGESLQHAADRARDFIEDLRKSGHKAVIVVTHGFITKAIYAYLNALPLEEADSCDLVQGTFAEFQI